jgi:integrase
MPVQKGRFWEARAKHKLLRPYRNSGILTKNFPTLEEAQDWETKTRAQLANGILPEEIEGDEERITRLGQAIKAYLAKVSIRPTEKDTLLVNYVRLGNTMLKDIDYAWAERWIDHMKHTLTLKPSTIRNHVGAVARCMDWLMRTEQSTLVRNPLRILPRGYASYTATDVIRLEVKEIQAPSDEHRDRRLEEGEEPAIRRILAGEKPKDKQRPLKLNEAVHLTALFDLALESAMRMSEMYTLTARQVDLSKSTVFLDKTKNGDKRQVPITTVAAALLATLLKGLKPDDLVFPWYGAKTYAKASPSERRKKVTAMLSQQYARVFEAAGCGDLRFHDLRHEATARIFERTTLSDVEIMNITGHKSAEMLRRYANLRGSKLASRLW